MARLLMFDASNRTQRTTLTRPHTADFLRTCHAHYRLCTLEPIGPSAARPVLRTAAHLTHIPTSFISQI
ncbi:hypothetical protein BOTBODRAFT_345740 [Botryobasidium botryosum FD-172 SS1]|uniref:Uncharacterized protein n=1 Tax=Botryobasidium botryosum (strain FD-172 SS1) TaxID=930990 RepID=A0A067MFI3_BOTB1|nr:hypothetical protein BOTBODRAFT_345740 [Botryobasidium botryosum FD-172 SS1]